MRAYGAITLPSAPFEPLPALRSGRGAGNQPKTTPRCLDARSSAASPPRIPDATDINADQYAPARSEERTRPSVQVSCPPTGLSRTSVLDRGPARRGADRPSGARYTPTRATCRFGRSPARMNPSGACGGGRHQGWRGEAGRQSALHIIIITIDAGQQVPDDRTGACVRSSCVRHVSCNRSRQRSLIGSWAFNGKSIDIGMSLSVDFRVANELPCSLLWHRGRVGTRSRRSSGGNEHPPPGARRGGATGVACVRHCQIHRIAHSISRECWVDMRAASFPQACSTRTLPAPVGSFARAMRRFAQIRESRSCTAQVSASSTGALDVLRQRCGNTR